MRREKEVSFLYVFFVCSDPPYKRKLCFVLFFKKHFHSTLER